MLQSGNTRRFRIIIALVMLLSLISWSDVKTVSADPGKMIWTMVNTPSTLNNVIAPAIGSEINVIAIGSDSRTFYAADIPAGRLYKSNDGGVTWQYELSTQLIAATASMPIWNIAVAPDDANFVVAVTDLPGVPVAGPGQVFISTDGGAIWQNTNFTAAGEWISCVDVSVAYGGTNRDVAIGTRTGPPGGGTVYTMKAAGFSNWVNQGLPASDVVALKFSPNYPTDTGLVVVSSSAGDTRVSIGLRDTAANATNWATYGPVAVTDGTGPSPTVGQIVTADLEFPSDFSAQVPDQRHMYISTDATGNQTGVYRIDNTTVYHINPPFPAGSRISSIAYVGTYTSGKLLAGEVTDTTILGRVNVWRTTNSTVTTPTWLKSDTNKSPTGGVNPGRYANAQVAWNSDGTRAYCGTSSACLGPFIFPIGALCAPPQWPGGYLNPVALDESAFSVSPYSYDYEQLLKSFSKTQDADVGNIWNQLSLIDTKMNKLTDVAALEAPQIGETLTTKDYDILYLYSLDSAGFSSIWRSTSDTLGNNWERVLCLASDNVSILRVRQPSYEEETRSNVVVFAGLGSDVVGFSSNEGQAWTISNLTKVTDLAISTDTVIYILNNTVVYKYEQLGTNWTFKTNVDTALDAGHTIAVPLKNPKKTGGTAPTADMVLVGEVGPPFGSGRISYADFSDSIVKPNPPVSSRIPPPIPGDAHVIFDDMFDANNTIYNATRDPISGNGKIYRWILDKSTAWSELEPPNSAFYGLVQRNNVLYGAWRKPEVAAIATNTAGVDRTLYPRINVPPPPEWDYLIEGIPIIPPFIFFTLEPSSLKISSNGFTNLWAIDDNAYSFTLDTGRLWQYTDIIAKVGPWTIAPASGSYIPVDPRTGRAVEVNFSWRSLGNITVYELQVAKDSNFANRVLVNTNIAPTNQLAPEVYMPAGALIPVSGSNIGSWGNLESGHTYYWRVRARRAATNENTRSPWSATMYFTIEAGLPTTSAFSTLTLFNPRYGVRNVPTTPSFSWSGLPGITEYEFVLAKDINLQQVIVKANVPTTSYNYDGQLDYNTNYYWQVRALLPVVSDPSPIGVFTVVAESKPVTPSTGPAPSTPLWIWGVVAVVVAVVGVIIAAATVKPSYSKTGGGKLFKIEPIVEKPMGPVADKPMGSFFEKPKNPISKIWESITAAIRRWRFMRKRNDGGSMDSGAGGAQASDNQDKLT